MKKLNRIIVSMLLIFSFILPSVYALENTTKEEIVYVSLETNGKTKGVYVVNAFEVDSKQEIIDFGEYENVSNITNSDEISISGDEIKADAEKGIFFYQGDNPNKELPWNIEIKYIHDGKELSPEEIAGKEGEVQIQGKVTRNQSADSIYAEYFLGQMAFNIDSKNAVVKEAEGSTLGYNGSVQILNYTILPEEDLEFEIVLDSKSFEMDPFTFSAVPFNMDFDMPDTSEFTDGLGQLESAIKQIGDGTSEIAGGALELNANTQFLYTSLYELYDGLAQSQSGAKELADGSAKFDNGLKQYQGGINQLVSNVDTLSSGMTSLKTGLTEMSTGSKELNSGVLEFATGLKQYTDGVSKLETGHKEFTTGLETLVKESEQLVTGGDQVVAGSNQILEGLAMFDTTALSENLKLDELENIKPLVDGMSEFWTQLESSLGQLDVSQIITALEGIKSVHQDSVQRLSAVLPADMNNITGSLGITDLENPDVQILLGELGKAYEAIAYVNYALNETSNMIDQYNQQNAALAESMKNLDAFGEQISTQLGGISQAFEDFDPEQITTGLQQLGSFAEQYKLFHEGLVAYVDGTKQFVNSIETQILPASQQFDKGFAQLTQSNPQLNSAINEISGGFTEISKGLEQVVSQLNFEDLSQIGELKFGMDELVKNHGFITSGQKSLADGLGQLSGGMLEYINGFGQFRNGLGSLTDGITEFESGTSQLSNETDGMAAEAQAQMDEAMAQFTKEGFELKSFVSDKNVNINHLQFAYVSDAITKPVENIEVEEVEEMSFFEKLWDVIKFWD